MKYILLTDQKEFVKVIDTPIDLEDRINVTEFIHAYFRDVGKITEVSSEKFTYMDNRGGVYTYYLIEIDKMSICFYGYTIHNLNKYSDPISPSTLKNKYDT